MQYVGIDWAYRRAAWCALSDGGAISAEGMVPADEDGLARLVLTLGLEVRACVEVMSGAVWVRGRLAAAGWDVEGAHARPTKRRQRRILGDTSICGACPNRRDRRRARRARSARDFTDNVRPPIARTPTGSCSRWRARSSRPPTAGALTTSAQLASSTRCGTSASSTSYGRWRCSRALDAHDAAVKVDRRPVEREQLARAQPGV